MADSTPNTKSPMGFLELPTEIRIMIYRNLLVSDRPLNALQPQKYGSIPDSTSAIPSDLHWLKNAAIHRPRGQEGLGLMRTCRKICEEGAEVFFKENEFDFNNCDEMYNYLYLVGEKCRGHIQRVLFDWDGVKIKESFQLLATLPKLEVLDIMPTYEISVEAMLNMGDKRARRADKHNNILWGCNLKHAPGMDELQKIRGCKEVNLWQNGYVNHQHIEKIEHLLKKLLCQERQEVVATEFEETAPEDTESSA